MKNFKEFITKFDVHISSFILFLILADVLLQVVSRILPGNAISWTLEVGEMLLGALIWLGISAAVLTGGHVAFDLFVKMFPKITRKGFGIIANILFMVHVALLGSFTSTLLGYYLKLGSKSTILGISMFWVRMPILIGCVFTLIRLLISTYRIIRNEEMPFPDVEL